MCDQHSTEVVRCFVPASVSRTVRPTAEEMALLLRAEMEAKGITQAEFARRVGVSTKHLCLVLNGNASARPHALDYWAYCLGKRFSVRLVKL